MRVAVLQEKYAEVFAETLGTIMPYQAKLNVSKEAAPRFFKPRSVPFFLAACYIDDIILTGKTDEEHLKQLHEVLQCLWWHGLHVKWTKCKFMQPSVNFLWMMKEFTPQQKSFKLL